MATLNDHWRSFAAEPSADRFEPFYEASRALVWSLCRRILGNEEDARDAFQATYARLLALARGGDADTEPAERAVLKMAVREAQNLSKRRSRRGRRETAMPEFESFRDGAPTPASVAERLEIGERLAMLVGLLPDRYRLPLLLHYYHGKNQLEIAEILGHSRQAVARRMDKGLRLLEPLARRAGLGETLSALAATGGATLLLHPPQAAAFAAANVFAQAGTATVATGVGAMAWSGTLIAKCAATAAVVMLAAGGVFLAARDQPPEVSAAAAMGEFQSADAVAANAAAQVPSELAVSAQAPTPEVRELTVAAATLTPNATPTPAPMPPGPSRRLPVQVVWYADGTPVPGATVTVVRRGGGPSDYRAIATTDAQGMVEVEMPEAYNPLRAIADHPEAPTFSMTLNMPLEKPALLQLTRESRIYGRVIDGRSGATVAGAKVILSPSGGDVVSGADGSFEFGRLKAGQYTPVALMDDLRSDMNPSAPVDVAKATRVGPVELTLLPGAAIQGRVTDRASGRPLSDVEVSVNRFSDIQVLQGKVVTGWNGHYSLSGLPGQKIPLAARPAAHLWEERLVEVKAEESVICDFAMEPGGEVLATVVDAEGKPIEGATVSVQSSTMLYQDMQTKTDASGQALIGPIDPEAPLEISAHRSGFMGNSKSPEPFAIDKRGEVRLELRPETFAPVTLAGKVTDPDGKPLAGIRVAYGLMGSSILTETPKFQTISGAGGEYRLEIAQPTGEAAVASGKGWAFQLSPELLATLSSKTLSADFKMKPGRRIQGVVVDERGRPLADVEVMTSLPTMSQMWISARTNADGMFTFDGMPAEKVHLSFRAADRPGQFKEVAPDSGPLRVALEGKPNGFVEGRVLDARTGEPVRAFTVRVPYNAGSERPLMAGEALSVIRSGGQAFSSDGGLFRIGDLTPGRHYSFLIEATDYATQFLENIPASSGGNEAVEIRLEAGAGLAGIVSDKKTGQPVAGAKVYGLIGHRDLVPWETLRNSLVGGVIEVIAAGTTGADGRFSLGISQEKITLVIEPAQHERMVLSAAGMEKLRVGNELIIPVERAAILEVILNENEAPQRTSTLELYYRSGPEPRWNDSLDFATSGSRSVFSSLPAGEYTLNVMVTEPSGRTGCASQSRAFRLGIGERKVVDLSEGLGEAILYGAVRDRQGNPMARAIIGMTPDFDWEITGLMAISDGKGIYALHGLRPGRYRARINSPDFESRQFMEDSIEVKGDRQYDIDFGGGHGATVRLSFDENENPGLIGQFDTVGLAVVDPRQYMQDQESVQYGASAKIEANTARLEGKLRGNYRLSLSSRLDSVGSIQLTLPQVYDLNTMEEDQDLGEVRVPRLGSISVKVQLADGLEEPKNGGVGLRLFQDKEGGCQTVVGLPPKAGVYQAIPVIAGNYKATINSLGCLAEHEFIDVTVSAGKNAGPIVFKIIPDGVIMGSVAGDESSNNPQPTAIEGLHLTLTGPGVNRSIAAAPLPDAPERIQLIDQDSMVFGSSFYFRRLEKGNYRLRAEAPGYEPEEQTVQVVPGTPTSLQLRLVKLGRP